MSNQPAICNDARLRQLLAGGGDDPPIEQHVESCPRCQSRLAELAGDNDAWHEARRHLETSDVDKQLMAEVRQRPWNGDVASGEIECGGHESRPAAAWTETMARQLLAPPSHPEMLGRLGRYEVERLIGSGGMGIVFKGFDTELNRPVAIKVLAPHLSGSGAARQRFSREARAAAAVVHEHVVAIHNVESEGPPQHKPDARARGDAPPPSPFLVMQYVAGESLQARLDRQGPLALREILRIAHQTAAGLAAAHAQGLVHRDVKPSNILLEEGLERALLTDFGLARAADDASLTHTGYMPGTPHYMSPEQARGEGVEARSDLFSLGSVIYAMCTGRPPFRADTSFGVLRRITDTDPRPVGEVNADIPGWLATLIETLLAKQPADRFASAREVADLLAQCLAHVQQPTTVPLPSSCRVGSAHHRAARWVAALPRRPMVFLGAIGPSLLLLAGLAAYLTNPHVPSQTPSQPRSAENGGSIGDASLSALDWNAAANEISSLSAGVADLEQRADQLWDRQPSPTPTEPIQEALP